LSQESSIAIQQNHMMQRYTMKIIQYMELKFPAMSAFSRLMYRTITHRIYVSTKKTSN